MSATIKPKRSLVSISQFNKGEASRIFDRLHTEDQIVVFKNNQPAAVILSPEEYDRLTEVEEDNLLLLEALERLQEHKDQSDIPIEDIMAELGITQKGLDAVDEVELS